MNTAFKTSVFRTSATTTLWLDSRASLWRLRLQRVAAASLLAALLLFNPTDSYAFNAYFQAAPNPSTGNYTLSWDAPSGRTWLQERYNGGPWSTIATNSPSSPMSFSKTDPGTYEYRLGWLMQECASGARRRSDCTYTTVYSSPEVVSVGPPPALDGFAGNYDLRVGDANGDGLSDLYLDLDSPYNGADAEEGVLLVAEQSGRFTLYRNMAQTLRQIYQGWPMSSATSSQNDVNGDAQMDVILHGLSDLPYFSSSVDDIVLFGGESGSSALLRLDDATKSFFVDVYGWSKNPDYFEDRAIFEGWYEYDGVERTGWFYISYVNNFYTFDNGLRFLDPSDDPNDSSNTPNYCSYYPWSCAFDPTAGAWLVYGTFLTNIQVIFDYSNFHPDALEVAGIIGDDFRRGIGPAGSAQDVNRVYDIFESMLGVSIGTHASEVLGFPLTLPTQGPSGQPIPAPSPKPTPPWDLRTPPANDPIFRNRAPWIVIGRVAIVIGGIFFPSDLGDGTVYDEDWFQFGIEWAWYEIIEDYDGDLNAPRAVIGEGEGDSTLATPNRIPTTAASLGAIFFDVGKFTDGPITPETGRLLWSMNAAVIETWMVLDFTIFDIGLAIGRSSRGPFYPCERSLIASFMYPRTEYPLEDTLSFTPRTSCEF